MVLFIFSFVTFKYHNMGTNLEWFQRSFYNISHDQDVISNLSEIKIALSALNTNQLKYTSSSLNLSEIFDCLNSSVKNQIQLACEVLRTFLFALDPAVILSQYGVAVVRALKHPNVEVKQLVLKELNRAACESDLAPRLSQEQELLLCVVECVGHEEIAVARSSIQFLVRLGSSAPGLAAIYSPAMLQALATVSQTNDTNRFRIYEIAVEVSTNSAPGLEASHASGILEKLLLELKEDDVLLLLTTLEFVTKLALTYHGFNYLESHGVVHHLASQINNIETNPLALLVLPGLIKFFGNVAQLRPQETFRDYPKVTETIFMLLNSVDKNLACVALETVGYIGTTPPGKRTLQKQGTVMKDVMTKIFEVILKWPSESRIRGMNTLANILRLELSEQESELLGIVEGWFAEMGLPLQVMSHVLDMAHQPFPDIKLAALLLLQVLAEQPWSQRLILNTPGLVELLVDRGGDSTMQEKAARFAVINTLAESPTSEAIFGEETVKRFRKFTGEGAVYVATETEVAIEKVD